jgi:hypothetical protein
MVYPSLKSMTSRENFYATTFLLIQPRLLNIMCLELFLTFFENNALSSSDTATSTQKPKINRVPRKKSSPEELRGSESTSVNVKPVLTKTPATGSTKPVLTKTPATGSTKPALAKTPAMSAAKPALAKAPATGAAKPAIAKAPASGAAKPALAKAPASGAAKPALAKAPATGAANSEEANAPSTDKANPAVAKKPSLGPTKILAGNMASATTSGVLPKKPVSAKSKKTGQSSIGMPKIIAFSLGALVVSASGVYFLINQNSHADNPNVESALTTSSAHSSKNNRPNNDDDAWGATNTSGPIKRYPSLAEAPKGITLYQEKATGVVLDVSDLPETYRTRYSKNKEFFREIKN